MLSLAHPCALNIDRVPEPDRPPAQLPMSVPSWARTGEYFPEWRRPTLPFDFVVRDVGASVWARDRSDESLELVAPGRLIARTVNRRHYLVWQLPDGSERTSFVRSVTSLHGSYLTDRPGWFLRLGLVEFSRNTVRLAAAVFLAQLMSERAA